MNALILHYQIHDMLSPSVVSYIHLLLYILGLDNYIHLLQRCKIERFFLKTTSLNTNSIFKSIFVNCVFSGEYDSHTIYKYRVIKFFLKILIPTLMVLEFKNFSHSLLTHIHVTHKYFHIQSYLFNLKLRINL